MRNRPHGDGRCPDEKEEPCRWKSRPFLPAETGRRSGRPAVWQTSRASPDGPASHFAEGRLLLLPPRAVPALVKEKQLRSRPVPLLKKSVPLQSVNINQRYYTSSIIPISVYGVPISVSHPLSRHILSTNEKPGDLMFWQQKNLSSPSRLLGTKNLFFIIFSLRNRFIPAGFFLTAAAASSRRRCRWPRH